MYLVSAVSVVSTHVLHIDHHLVFSLRLKFACGVHLRVCCAVDRLVIATNLKLRSPLLTTACSRFWHWSRDRFLRLGDTRLLLPLAESLQVLTFLVLDGLSIELFQEPSEEHNLVSVLESLTNRVALHLEVADPLAGHEHWR